MIKRRYEPFVHSEESFCALSMRKKQGQRLFRTLYEAAKHWNRRRLQREVLCRKTLCAAPWMSAGL